MRRAAVGLLLGSLSFGAGSATAAPPDSLGVRTGVQRVAPGTITSEASLEYFIAAAARLVKGDSAKDLAAMAARLEALKRQKQSLGQQMAAQQSLADAARVAHDAVRAAKVAAQIDALKAQLAAVDVEIKEILQAMEHKRKEEEDIKDDIAAAQEALGRLNEALDKAASHYTAIVGAASLNTFVRGLSPDKKRETQNRVRQALAQLAEARRLQLSASSAAFQPAPKPLTTK